LKVRVLLFRPQQEIQPRAMNIASSKQKNGPADLSDQLQDTQTRTKALSVSLTDVEKQARMREATNLAPSPDPRDPDLVNWNGPDDLENPKNWEMKKKWLIVLIVSTYSLISPLSSSMVAPSLTAIGKDLDIPAGVQQAVAMSIFVLAYAVGPLFVGPLSEIYGRVLVLQLTNLLYLFFNLGCSLAKTKAQIIVFRFLAGLGGSAPLAIGGGVVSDLFSAEQRGQAISIYSLMPLFGPAIGPIAGAFITENTTWRWSFYATTIADGVVQCLGFLFLRETYAPVLLAWKRDKLIKTSGNTNLHTAFDIQNRTTLTTLQIALTRPFRLLGTQIILQVLALYLTFLYGLMYLVLVSFPDLFSSPKPEGYGESIGIGGLNYISLGLGFFIGAQVVAPLQDRIYIALKRRHSSPGRPEYRVPMMLPGAVLVPLGLFIYGWTAEYKTHWIGPNIGACLIAAGIMIGSLCTQAFLVDTYTVYAASALGAATVLRSLAGFGFPLFASSLYDRLGLGWGNSLLAFVAIVIGWPSPVILWFYGEKMRMRSPFAAG
ncbi:uncharacterized protein N7529_009457, partial [Penicillium soppii]|uniref:uncharacterized protein n=1 Tax=Penicillium soppii TaxID=69789 RepID=UPI002546CFCC